MPNRVRNGLDQRSQSQRITPVETRDSDLAGAEADVVCNIGELAGETDAQSLQVAVCTFVTVHRGVGPTERAGVDTHEDANEVRHAGARWRRLDGPARGRSSVVLTNDRDVASCAAGSSSVLAIRGEENVDSTAVGPPHAAREGSATTPSCALTA